MRELAALTPAQFSPQWDPSAALAHRQAAGRLLEAVLLAVDLPAGSWVRARFLERLRVMIPAWIDSSVIWLVQEDRIHRLIYTDPAIFQAEMTNIFAAVWVYLGHESQIPGSQVS